LGDGAGGHPGGLGVGSAAVLETVSAVAMMAPVTATASLVKRARVMAVTTAVSISGGLR
jgi:hypothetical protein